MPRMLDRSGLLQVFVRPVTANHAPSLHILYLSILDKLMKSSNERLLANKSMPAQNSPSNQSGVKRSTMTKEYIIVCEKPFGTESWVVCDKVSEKGNKKYKAKNRKVIKIIKK